LKEYDNALRQEQIAHDALNEKNVKECKEEFEFRNDEIEEATDKGDIAREKHEECK
jgi:hypothetical protein